MNALQDAGWEFLSRCSPTLKLTLTEQQKSVLKKENWNLLPYIKMNIVPNSSNIVY
jgi:hypothetical protein